jgi:hypothetical protein
MNRYSGARLDGRDRLGALYLGSLSGILREHVHYTLNPPTKDGKPSLVCANSSEVGRPPARLLGGPDLTRDQIKREVLGSASAAGKRIFHAYRLSRAVSLADIRVPALAKLFSALLSQPATRRKFGIAEQAASHGLVQEVLAASDYSAARGMADAIAELHATRNISGLCATSARGDSDSGVALQDHGDGAVGEVYVLFGAPGQRISVLAPVSSYASFQELRDKVKALPGFAGTV